MTFKVYFDLLSQPARAVVLFLKVNNIPYQPCPVALRKAEHLSDEYKKINPFQKVPAINDNGFKLTESVAILRYLSREKGVPEHWYPRDSKQQACVDEYLEWQHSNTRYHCAMYFQTKFLIPFMTGEPANQKGVDKFKNYMEKTLDFFQDVWLKDRPYITGQQITIADLLGACELEQPGIAGYDIYEGRPILKAYMDRVKNDTSPYYDEVHEYVYKMKKKFGGDPFGAKL